MSRVKLFFQFGSAVLEANARIGSRLATIIRKEGLATPEFYECQYKLECANCIVDNEDGLLGPPTLEESNLLMQKGVIKNTRCSCQVFIDENMQEKLIKIK